MAHTYTFLDNEGADVLIRSDVDNEGVVDEQINQSVFWNDETENDMVFFVNPPTLPVDPPTVPPPSSGGLPANPLLFDSYNGTKVFESYNPRMFLS